MSISPLKDVLQKVAAQRNLGMQLSAAHIFQVYRNFVFDELGEAHLTETQALYIKQGLLWVSASNSSLAQEIQGRALLFLDRLKREIPRSGVQGIRIVQQAKRSAYKEPVVEEEGFF